MEKENIKPIEDNEATDVVSFGSKDTYIVVETIANLVIWWTTLILKMRCSIANPATQNIEIKSLNMIF